MKLFFSMLLVVAGIFVLGKDRQQRKIIVDGDLKFVFHVSTANPTKYVNDRIYYWFKSGEIHHSEGGSDGDILHGTFVKSHRDNSILEKGSFENGLKDKVWKQWYKNGTLKQVLEWKEGLKTGKTMIYDEKGQVINSGYYHKNVKHGIWVDHSMGDTLYFDKGKELKIPKENFPKRVKTFFKRLFSKKNQKPEEEKQQTNPETSEATKSTIKN